MHSQFCNWFPYFIFHFSSLIFILISISKDHQISFDYIFNALMEFYIIWFGILKFALILAIRSSTYIYIFSNLIFQLQLCSFIYFVWSFLGVEWLGCKFSKRILYLDLDSKSCFACITLSLIWQVVNRFCFFQSLIYFCRHSPFVLTSFTFT